MTGARSPFDKGGRMRHGNGDFDPGMRVKLSELGRRHSKFPDRRGVVVAPSRSGSAFRVQWEELKTADFVHRSFLQVSAESQAEQGVT